MSPPDTDDVPVSDGGPVHLLLPLRPHLHLVVPHLAPEAGLEKRLEPQGHFPTAGILAHREGGVLELNVGVLGLPGVEGAELHHVELELSVAETADPHVTNSPESPENLPPGFQLQFE